MFAALVALLPFLTPAAAAPATAPIEHEIAVREFAAALTNQDLAKARKMLQPLANPVTPDELERKLQRLADALVRQQVQWTILESRTAGDVALVMIKEAKQNRASNDIDPVFLVRRAGNWKLLLDDPDEHGLVEVELKSGRELMDWYKQRKKELAG